MTVLRCKLVIVAAILASLGVTEMASADLSNDLAYGLQLYGIKYSKTYDPLSKGYLLNVSATDPKTGLPYYNNTNFYMGFANLEMVSGSFNTRIALTNRVVPTARFAMTTNGAPLNYKFTTFLGAQDVTIEGGLLLDIDSRINEWGFYDVSLQASNRATITSDGWLAENKKLPDVNFDIGPINMDGNIYVDALATITDPFFDKFGLDNPFAQFQKGLAGLNLKGAGVEDMLAQLDSGQLLSDGDLGRLVNNTIMANLLGKDPSSDLLSRLILPDGLLKGNVEPAQDSASPRPFAAAVPEPGMLALLAIAGAGYFVLPRRRTKR
jgi:hypothetical protein